MGSDTTQPVSEKAKPPMSLAEAIREGSRLRPQGLGPVSRRTDSDTSCALEAASEALTGDAHRWATEIDKVFPALAAHGNYACPGVLPDGRPCDGRSHLALAIVTHLNDQHRWTREQIADWVESIESVLSTAGDS